jgi:TonB family protein
MPVDAALKVRFQGLSNKIGLTKKVTLLLSSKTDVPMAIGWLKPVVLIPFSMVSGLTPQQLDMLLLHELAHIRRHDYLVNFLQTLVETLLFFHPTVRWVSKQMRNEREYCSDDIAVQHGSSAVAYAHTLADTASLCQKHRHHAIPNMAMAASGGDLKQRVVRLLDKQPHCSQTTDSGRWLASFTILLAIVFIFSKNTLTLPIIDLQSGSISLSHSPVDLNINPVTYTPLIIDSLGANSSLANQLIALNDAKNNINEKSVVTKATNDNNYLVSSQETMLTTQTPASASSSNLSPQSNIIYIDEQPIVVNSSVEQGSKQAQNNLAAEATLTDRQVSIPSVNKSISDLAFERTDSKNTTATLANPYAQQVASLLDKPKETPAQFKVQQQSKLTELDNIPTNIYRSIDSRISNKFNDIETTDFTIDSETLLANSLAKLITSMEPRYPSSAKRKGIELEIMVEFSIDKNGFVRDIQFESKSKVNYFRNAIRNAMDKWRFLPAKENGTAVESKMSKIFSFSLLK